VFLVVLDHYLQLSAFFWAVPEPLDLPNATLSTSRSRPSPTDSGNRTARRNGVSGAKASSRRECFSPRFRRIAPYFALSTQSHAQSRYGTGMIRLKHTLEHRTRRASVLFAQPSKKEKRLRSELSLLSASVPLNAPAPPPPSCPTASVPLPSRTRRRRISSKSSQHQQLSTRSFGIAQRGGLQSLSVSVTSVPQVYGVR